ncbi:MULTISPECIES: hypothetical protein [Allobacillus]|uniref:Uncharacterized protein n=1 Tax=Allobacillus halotolerans TaxID=570278 RepID=A0ABS6GLB6_9BACI|nr:MULTISPECIES: hypothetical protein [Allobacillus]MBU6079903.1 hypothetical protein [Allobacillus halotolerans]TSJ62416.1 hypothetical protein FPQ10_11975 [Allobacillus sp. SKP2-8]
MRYIKMSQIEQNIDKNRKKVNERIHSRKAQQPQVKKIKRRSADERRALTAVAKASVDRAKKEDKMKMIGKRRMYYDPSE